MTDLLAAPAWALLLAFLVPVAVAGALGLVYGPAAGGLAADPDDAAAPVAAAPVPAAPVAAEPTAGVVSPAWNRTAPVRTSLRTVVETLTRTRSSRQVEDWVLYLALIVLVVGTETLLLGDRSVLLGLLLATMAGATVGCTMLAWLRSRGVARFDWVAATGLWLSPLLLALGAAGFQYAVSRGFDNARFTRLEADAGPSPSLGAPGTYIDSVAVMARALEAVYGGAWVAVVGTDLVAVLALLVGALRLFDAARGVLAAANVAGGDDGWRGRARRTAERYAPRSTGALVRLAVLPLVLSGLLATGLPAWALDRVRVVTTRPLLDASAVAAPEKLGGKLGRREDSGRGDGLVGRFWDSLQTGYATAFAVAPAPGGGRAVTQPPGSALAPAPAASGPAPAASGPAPGSAAPLPGGAAPVATLVTKRCAEERVRSVELWSLGPPGGDQPDLLWRATADRRLPERVLLGGSNTGFTVEVPLAEPPAANDRAEVRLVTTRSGERRIRFRIAALRPVTVVTGEGVAPLAAWDALEPCAAP